MSDREEPNFVVMVYSVYGCLACYLGIPQAEFHGWSSVGPGYDATISIAGTTDQ